MGYKVTVVGATGNVGREMLNILAERNSYDAGSCAIVHALQIRPNGFFSENPANDVPPSAKKAVEKKSCCGG